MSVYKSRRKDAAALFIVAAMELRKETIRIVAKFPKSYRWIVTNNMLELANAVYTNALKANAIYVHKDMAEQDFDLRHRYLMIAITSADALLGEISFCYDMVQSGNNFFEGKADYDKTFWRWTEAGDNAAKKLRAVADSDKLRWNKWKKAAE